MWPNFPFRWPQETMRSTETTPSWTWEPECLYITRPRTIITASTWAKCTFWPLIITSTETLQLKISKECLNGSKLISRPPTLVEVKDLGLSLLPISLFTAHSTLWRIRLRKDAIISMKDGWSLKSFTLNIVWIWSCKATFIPGKGLYLFSFWYINVNRMGPTYKNASLNYSSWSPDHRKTHLINPEGPVYTIEGAAGNSYFMAPHSKILPLKEGLMLIFSAIGKLFDRFGPNIELFDLDNCEWKCFEIWTY